MTNVIGKKVLATSGEYLGKVENLDYKTENKQGLIVKDGSWIFGDKRHIDLSNVVGINDVVIVKVQPEEKGSE